LLRGAWREAAGCFERALVLEASTTAYEGLGVAARYLADVAAAVDAHERGYRLARARGDAQAAARLAVQLGLDAYGQARFAEASGWIERALVLTDGVDACEARAFALALRAHVALLARNAPGEARVLAGQALAAARASHSTDVELVSLAIEGLALVCEGAIDDGMRLLDLATAAAVAGEVGDVDMAETICCYLIDACKRVRDLERAAEWCARVQEIAERFEDRYMFAVCRVHHADILVWRGEWERADHELTLAAQLLAEIVGEKAVDSLVRLAELRRRQGRLDEAAALLGRCERHRLHALHGGLLALDRGMAGEAVDEAGRFLRRVGAADRFERVAGLELLVRAAVRTGQVDAAGEAAGELDVLASVVGTGPLRAAALLAAGRVAAARGDHTAARALLEDAAAGYDRAGAPYEAALARLDLAATLLALGLGELARSQSARAADALARLGAAAPRPDGDGGPLSPRERQVLGLVARGRSNDEIAAALVLSVRTVERHVANVYDKLGLSGRTARAAATAWAHEHGIA